SSRHGHFFEVLNALPLLLHETLTFSNMAHRKCKVTLRHYEAALTRVAIAEAHRASALVAARARATPRWEGQGRARNSRAALDLCSRVRTKREQKSEKKRAPRGGSKAPARHRGSVALSGRRREGNPAAAK